MTHKNGINELSFEAAMERLSETVDKLSAGNVPLDEMMRLYENGEALSKHCLALLDKYDARIDTLAADEAHDGV